MCNPMIMVKFIALIDVVIASLTLVFSVFGWVGLFGPYDRSALYTIKVPIWFIYYGLILLPLGATITIYNAWKLIKTLREPTLCRYECTKTVLFVVCEVVLELGIPFLAIEDYAGTIRKLVSYNQPLFWCFCLLDVDFLNNPLVLLLRIYEILSCVIVFFSKARISCLESTRRSKLERSQELQEVKVQHPNIRSRSSGRDLVHHRTVNAATHSNGVSRPRRSQTVRPDATNLYPDLHQLQQSLLPEPELLPSTSKVAKLSSANRGAGIYTTSFSELKEKWLKKYLETGKLYVDDDFSANESSLGTYLPGIKWKRPLEINGNAKFIVNGTDRFDIMQGSLGDCWFLAALASLTTELSLLENVIVSEQNDWDSTDYCGLFVFRFFVSGNWKEVMIDDRLPTKNNKLIYMHSRECDEFWSPLAEKAYAKLKGSYARLNGGYIGIAFQNLTGGGVEKFSIDGTFDASNLYKIIEDALKKNCLIGCSTLNSHESEESGLVTNHAYSVTKVAVVKMKNGISTRLLRIRNPWGNETEWNGIWSDGHHLWNCVDKETREQLMLIFEDDGEFWFPLREFADYFDMLEICYI